MNNLTKSNMSNAIENTVDIDPVQTIAAKYGWRVEKDKKGYKLFSKKNNFHAANIITKGKTSFIRSITDINIMSSNRGAATLLENALLNYWYCKPVTNAAT